MFVEYIKILEKCIISGMIIAHFKRIVVHVHLNGNVKKMLESLTEKTTEVTKILKIKIYSF